VQFALPNAMRVSLSSGSRRGARKAHSNNHIPIFQRGHRPADAGKDRLRGTSAENPKLGVFLNERTLMTSSISMPAHHPANYRFLTLQTSAGQAQVCLNRPTARNAMSRDLMRELIDIAHGLSQRTDIQVVILTGG
jgi:hypothetical protein